MALCVFMGNKCRFSDILKQPVLSAAVQKSSDVTFVVVEEKGPLPPESEVDGQIKGKLNTIRAQSTLDAMYKVKTHLDEAEILEAEIFVPENNLNDCGAFKKLLFPTIWNVTIHSFTVPEVHVSWNESVSKNSNYEEIVREYLAKVPSKTKVKTIKSNIIPSEQFVHGYATRYGGITSWLTMASMNLVYSLRKPDSLLVVKENSRRLCEQLGRDPDRYHLAKANHGNKIWVYEKALPESYDGIVTQTPGVTVASPAADCNMLLLTDPVVKACGAIHAGWKGILLGIVEASVKAMVTEYNSDPKNIIATLGPSLSVCCCEFGIEDSKKFTSIHKNVVVWRDGKEKPHIDLRLAAKVLLQKSGVKPENIDDGVDGSNPTAALAVCTKCDPKKEFFSYRRDGPKFGNQIGFISIK